MKRDSSKINNNTSPVAGWKLEDQNYLRKYDNASANPEWQLLTEDAWEDEDKEQRDYYCASCKSKLEYHKHLSIWICSECFAEYDTNIQDVPIKDTKEFRVKTYPALIVNSTYDEQDIHMPFVEGIDLDRETGKVKLVRSSDDRRVQHIKVQGLPTETLAAMNEIDGKT